ncbi:MAG: hypothetical protein K6B17_08725 [Treponema sp.]|nr:hypothetical protein [Treponema sp.]
MKKRSLIGALFVLIMTSTFAIETKYQQFGFNFSVPLVFESEEENGLKSDTSITSIAIGIDALTLYTDKIGLYANFEIVFPQKLSTELSYGGSTVSYDLSRDDYDSLWGLTALFGPAFCISKSDTGIVTISPGLHYILVFAETPLSSVSSYLLGIGVNLQKSFFFGDNGYISIGADLAYDFLGTTTTDGQSSSGTTRDLIFVPRVGIGFRF